MGEVRQSHVDGDLATVIAVSSAQCKYIADTRDASHREYQYQHVASA